MTPLSIRTASTSLLYGFNFHEFKERFTSEVFPVLRSYVDSKKQSYNIQFSEVRRSTVCLEYFCDKRDSTIDMYVVGRPYEEVKSKDSTPFTLDELPSQVNKLANSIFSEMYPHYSDYECELVVSKLVDVCPLSLDEFIASAQLFVKHGIAPYRNIKTENEKQAYLHALLLANIQKIVGNSTNEALRFIQPIDLLQVDVEQAVKQEGQGTPKLEKWLARWRMLTEEEVAKKINEDYPDLVNPKTLGGMVQSIQVWRSLKSDQLKTIEDNVLEPIFSNGKSKAELNSLKQRLNTRLKYIRLDKDSFFNETHHRISIAFQPVRYHDCVESLSEKLGFEPVEQEDTFETPRASPTLLRKPKPFDQLPQESLNVEI